MTGNWREEHLFVLRQSLGMFDDIARHLVECDTKLHAGLKDLGEREADLGKAPRALRWKLLFLFRNTCPVRARMLTRNKIIESPFHNRK